MVQHVPEEIIRDVIKPLVYKQCDIHDSSKYHEIMDSSNMFKTFVKCLVPIFKRYTKISKVQLSRRSHTCTTLATANRKEVVGKHINEGSVVYPSFLDLNKAFVRVHQGLILHNTLDANLPLSVKNLLHSLYVCEK